MKLTQEQRQELKVMLRKEDEPKPQPKSLTLSEKIDFFLKQNAQGWKDRGVGYGARYNCRTFRDEIVVNRLF